MSSQGTSFITRREGHVSGHDMDFGSVRVTAVDRAKARRFAALLVVRAGLPEAEQLDALRELLDALGLAGDEGGNDPAAAR